MVLYNIINRTNNSGTIKELHCFSKTANIIDSTVVAPYEANFISLSERCRQQCFPFGIDVIVGDDVAAQLTQTHKVIQQLGMHQHDFDVGLTTIKYENLMKPGTNIFGNTIKFGIPITKSTWVTDEVKFPRVFAHPHDKIFEHLAKLASQMGLLLSNTRDGNLLITKAHVDAPSMGTIKEEFSAIADQFEAKFMGRDRFSIYRAMVHAPHHHKSTTIYKATDPVVRMPRLLSFDSNEVVPGGAKNAAEWRKNKSAADSMTIPFPVNSWYGPNGNLWDVNTAVTIISPTLNLLEGFTFLISQVEFKYENKGTSAVLKLLPPTVYSTGEIIEPWVQK